MSWALDAKTLNAAARLAAATPGPWASHKQTDGMILDGPERWVSIGRHQEARLGRSLAARVDADAEFIANAPSDMAYLLAENSRLRTALEIIAAEEYLNDVTQTWNATYVARAAVAGQDVSHLRGL